MTYFFILFVLMGDTEVDRQITYSRSECSALMGQYIKMDYDLFCQHTGIPSGSIRPMKRPVQEEEHGPVKGAKMKIHRPSVQAYQILPAKPIVNFIVGNNVTQ